LRAQAYCSCTAHVSTGIALFCEVCSLHHVVYGEGGAASFLKERLCKDLGVWLLSLDYSALYLCMSGAECILDLATVLHISNHASNCCVGPISGKGLAAIS
jgi:hypothetical protein